MSTEATSQPAPEQPRQGFEIFNHEYAKKLIIQKASAAGMPVSFIQTPLEQLWDSMAREGFALGRATDPAAQQAINQRLMPPANRNITFGFKAQ